MTFPTPTGAPQGGVSAYVSLADQSEAYYQGIIAKQWGSKAGNAYVTYDQNHPKNTPYYNAKVFVEIVLVQGLDKAIQKATTGASAVEIGTVEGAAKGGEKVVNAWSDLLKFLHIPNLIFSGTNFVIRAAKVIIGGTLLIIGLVHITGADNAVASIARKVPLPV